MGMLDNGPCMEKTLLELIVSFLGDESRIHIMLSRHEMGP